MTVTINIEDPSQPEIEQLLRNGEAFAAALYPAESNHFLSVDELRKDNVRFLVARTAEGKAVGTAATPLNAGWAELKRMWVEPEARGRGLARQLLRRVEAEASEAGATILRLETGVDSREALGLYSASGFSVIGPFGSYSPDPLSVFMEKQLKP